MAPTAARLSRLFDIRAGEGRTALLGFALLLMLIICGHTVMETARDALLLTGPGPRALGIVYMAIAATTLPASAVAARAGERFGQRRTLAGMLGVAAAVSVLLFLVPVSNLAAMATYVVSGLLGSILVPLLWTLVGTAMTVAQGRRLFGLIAAAGVVGGVLGPALAAATLAFLPVKSLLLLSAFVFVVAGAALGGVRVAERVQRPRGRRPPEVTNSVRTLREYPFLARVALLVFVSTATLLALDYLFKSTVARAMPAAQVGRFIARYYLCLNGISLFVQLFLSRGIVRRMGLGAAIVFTPMLLFGSAIGALLSGGAVPAVLLVKGIDGSLRYSVHRITGELVYLPVPPAARQRVKPLIDGGLSRTAQTLTGAALFALGGTTLLGPKTLSAILVVMTGLWLVTAISMRRPYLSLLHNALSKGPLDGQETPDPIDLGTAEMLVQHLASDDPVEVEAAMSALARRGHEGLVPALVLLQSDQDVLVQALEMFGSSHRTDWFTPARRLLEDPREPVRMAAARALARHDELDARLLAKDVGVRVRAYSAVLLALAGGAGSVLADATVAGLVRLPGDEGASARLGLLAAIADVARNDRLSPLLRALVEAPPSSGAEAELVAAAAARQHDTRTIPHLVALLGRRDGREAVRAALVELGEPALDDVWGALCDASRARRLRLHLPKTLARFGTTEAAEYLLESIETESDGLVRFKSIRALGLLRSEHRVPMDRARVEKISRAELGRHFRALDARVALGPADEPSPGPAPPAERLLVGMLDDKLRHSLERAFRLLEIAHPHDDIHHAYHGALSQDRYMRANAGEFLDALLRRRDQQQLRELLRLVVDDLPSRERIARARTVVPLGPEATRDQWLVRLARDPDPTVASLAGECARASGSEERRDHG